MRHALLLLLLTVTPLAGCRSSGSPVPAIRPDAPVAPAEASLEAYASALATPSPGARRIAAGEALRAAGFAPGAGDRFETGVAFPYAVGLLAGRVPAHRSDLVILAGSLDGASGPALLETARILAGRSVYVHEPARSVLVATWSTTWPDADVLPGVLRLGLWERARVRALVVAMPPEGLPAQIAGVPVIGVAGESPAALAAALLAATRREATPHRADPVSPSSAGLVPLAP